VKIVRDVLSRETFFDRQERLEGWDQTRLTEAKVLVAGAGALGNETLKNLALLGVRNFFICDFDTIETSNLSRTVLFSKSDLGRRKVDVAAERVSELILEQSPIIEIFDGDIVWELGLGRIADCDIILGCLDNVEARRHLGISSKRLGIPFVDAGISRLSGHVSVYPKKSEACYACNMSKAQEMTISRRYSCDDVRRKAYLEEKVPTVQVASALMSAIQCQEAIKILMNQTESKAYKISYDGKNLLFDRFDLLVSKSCEFVNHFEIKCLNLSIESSMSLLTVITELERHFAQPVKIDLSGDRYFLKRVRCRRCAKWVDIMKPNYVVTEQDLFCNSEGKCTTEDDNDFNEINDISEKDDMWQFDRNSVDCLNLTLREIGIPSSHIITVVLSDGVEYSIRLCG
jgi:molybdopterin-synthase adenylyltransferase